MTAQQRDRLAEVVRTCAHDADGETGFVQALRAAGVLVRPRLAGGTHAVTGYAVALPIEHGEPRWMGLGALGADVTLERLRQQWQAPRGLRAVEHRKDVGDE